MTGAVGIAVMVGAGGVGEGGAGGVTPSDGASRGVPAATGFPAADCCGSIGDDAGGRDVVTSAGVGTVVGTVGVVAAIAGGAGTGESATGCDVVASAGGEAGGVVAAKGAVVGATAGAAGRAIGAAALLAGSSVSG